MYSDYKSMRNFAAKLPLVESLVKVWAFYGNLDHDKPIPYKFARLNKSGRASLKNVVHPWELDILAREIVLHAGCGGSKDLYNVGHLSAAINNIRKITDVQSRSDIQYTLHQELQRLYQQQSLWRTNTHLMLARYLKLYSSPALSKVLQATTSLTIKQFYILGISISGHFLENYLYNTKQNYNMFGISDEQRDLFLEKMVLDFESLKKRTADVQEYGENWSFTINPLISTPLIVIDQSMPHIVICPIPYYLMYRISEGLFFDIANFQGYEQAYGDAFEEYVYDICNILNDKPDSLPSLKILKPTPYRIGKHEKHGVDIIVHDETGAVLIECKAKRLNLKARYQLNEKALYAEIDILAKYVVQNYKNLLDIKAGITNWESGDLPLYPVVVTLVSWNLFGPKAYERLELSVRDILERSNIDVSVLDMYPYSVMSIEEYEVALQVIRQIGVESFFSKWTGDNHRGWLVNPFIRDTFLKELKSCRSDYLNYILKDLQDEIGALI